MASETQNTVISKIIKLAVASLIVGFVVHFFGLTPERVWENLGETVHALWGIVQGFFTWAGDYILTGALIVVPIWAIVTVLKYVNNAISNRKK
ncbi:DUF6460 domain-containing protein [Curvivirga sp.]|uniref:DUF6460 domain-containing protein n=1 Tax=Curvivirga sp. TaxID=2856848 RepID=UPI003B5BF1F8